MAVAGSEGNAAEGGEGWSNVGGCNRLEVLAGLDVKAHQQNGNMLIVVVGHAVAGAVRARLSHGAATQEPVGCRPVEEAAATSGNITIHDGANGGALRCGMAPPCFGALDGGTT